MYRAVTSELTLAASQSIPEDFWKWLSFQASRALSATARRRSQATIARESKTARR
jgi:hypothetical protein